MAEPVRINDIFGQLKGMGFQQQNKNTLDRFPVTQNVVVEDERPLKKKNVLTTKGHDDDNDEDDGCSFDDMWIFSSFLTTRIGETFAKRIFRFYVHFQKNFRTFLITGINWGVALYVAGMCVQIVRGIFTPQKTHILLDMARCLIAVFGGSMLITLLGEFFHRDFTAVSLIGTGTGID